MWWLAFSSAFLFSNASFGDRINIRAYLDNLAKIVLILLAVGMVYLSIRDKKEKLYEKNQKTKLAKTLEKQKKALQNHFDLQKKIVSSSSLNFALGLEETLKNEEKTDKLPPAINTDASGEEEIVTQKKVSFTQINLKKSMVEGEDISSFSPEWQQYFVENEGKSNVEKLNKMLEMPSHEV